MKRFLVALLMFGFLTALGGVHVRSVEAAGTTTEQPAVIGGCPAGFNCSYTEYFKVSWYHDHSIGYVAAPTILVNGGCDGNGPDWSGCTVSSLSCYRWSYGQYNCDSYFRVWDVNYLYYQDHLNRIRMFSDGSWDQYGNY